MHHLDVVTRPLLPYPITTGHPSVHLRRNILHNLFHKGPSRWRAPRHDTRTVPCTLFSTRYSRADIKQSFGFHFLLSPVRILKKRVTAVDNNVPFFQEWHHLLNKIIHRLPSLDQKHHPPRPLQHRDHLLNRVGSQHFRALRLVREKIVHLGDGTIKGHHGVAVVIHVQNNVLAHDGQPDKGDITLGFV